MERIYSIMNFILPFEWASPDFMKNALLAVIVVCPLFGTLGTAVVSNRMSFFSDAIGHSSLTGIAIGVILGIREPTVAMVVFSLLLGFTIISVKLKGKASADTIIGVFSSASVALGIVLLSATGNFAKYQRYLVGDILSIRPGEIALLLIAAAGILLVWIFFYNRMLITILHLTFAKSRGIRTFWIEQIFALVTAATVTLSIRWTGLLVINSLLVLPAAASRFVSRTSRQYLCTSIAISFASGIAGLILSYYIGSASGATIVIINTVLFGLCFLFAAIKRRVQ